MPYTLGNLELPNPKSFQRSFVEISQGNQTIANKTTRKVVNRKEVFTLVFQNLTVAQVDSLISIYNLNQVVDFVVDEDNLTIASTPVLITMENRVYPRTAEEYRSNLQLVLKEVI